MSMPGLNKFCTCFWCTQQACNTAQCIDMWAACEACGLSNLHCGAFCWSFFAPICHKCECAGCSEPCGYCFKALKYCGYSCALNACAPIDGIYNCVKYICKCCGDGYTGFKDVMENTKWMNAKIRDCMELENGSEPEKTLNTYKP